jgi:hypothetical protein
MFVFWTFIVCLLGSWVTVVSRRFAAESGSNTEIGGNGAWQRKTYMFCLSEVAEIKCDGPDQMMQVTSAVYNRNTKADGNECEPLQSEWKSCKVNAKQMVEKQCKDTSGCHLIPDDHAHCEDEPFQQMRLVIKCRTAGDGDEIKKQPPRAGLDISVARVEGQEIAPAVIKELNDDHLQEVAFTPCYRSLTVEKVVEGDIESDSWRAQLSSTVTSCGEHDGCFHLTFPGGMVYSDPDEEPTSEELVKGELKEVGENMWVTYEGVGLQKIDYGIGLKRNDYGSWGICLPKTKTLQFAASLWDTMRKSLKQAK